MQPVRMSARERQAYAQGRGCFERGETDAALSAFGELLRTRGGFADVHYMVGVLHERRGDLDSATDSLREAVRLNPSYAEALLALASVHERRGDFDRSRDFAQRAEAVSRASEGPLDATTRAKLANLQAAVADAYAEAGELREAVEAYRKALDRCPDFHDIRQRLGVALREAGLPAQALLEQQRVLRGNPNLIAARVQLALTLYSLGRGKDAIHEWERVLEQDPTCEEARMYLRMLEQRSGDLP